MLYIVVAISPTEMSERTSEFWVHKGMMQFMSIDPEFKKEMVKNNQAMFYHLIGLH